MPANEVRRVHCVHDRQNFLNLVVVKAHGISKACGYTRLNGLKGLRNFISCPYGRHNPSLIRHMKGEAKLGLELGVVIGRPELSGIFTNLRPI